MALGGQLASVWRAVSFGPLLHGRALRRHKGNRMAQDSACREQQPLVGGWRIAEAYNIGKQIAAVGIAGARALDDLGYEIPSLHFR